jgi:hypothetical protein
MTRPTCTFTRVEQVEPFLSSRQYFLTDALTRDSTLAGVVFLIICLSVSAVPVDSSGTCAFAPPSAGVVHSSRSWLKALSSRRQSSILALDLTAGDSGFHSNNSSRVLFGCFRLTLYLPDLRDQTGASARRKRMTKGLPETPDALIASGVLSL